MFSLCNISTHWRRLIALVLMGNLLISGCSPRIALFKDEVNRVEENPGEFSIAVLPDTQYYTSEKIGGKNEMFKSQIEWIKKNKVAENIAYVIHVGDIVDSGDKFPKEWSNAAEAILSLETPLPGLPNGIPYGLAVGNHDQAKSQFPLSGPTDYFNKYFGVPHFKGRNYYGGHYGKDNDSHYDLISAGGNDFLILYIEFDAMDEDQENMNSWACEVLEKYPSRKAIIVSHYIVENNKVAGTNEKGFAPFGKQGVRLYDRIKRYPNVFMMLCGHIGDNGEGFRQDYYAGSSIKTFLADYQSRKNGGDGMMRIMKFSKQKDLISVRTFSPYTGVEEKDADSEFTTTWMRGTNSTRIFDFKNTNHSEISFFNNGLWNTQDMKEVSFGKAGDIAVPADYNGDGKIELAVFRPAEGKFYVDGGKEWKGGVANDIPVTGDYDGDGFADFVTYRPSDFKWYFNGVEGPKFGGKDYIPVPADYDGDGKTDMALFRPLSGMWQIYGLANIPFGKAGDIPVPADYDGDGKNEIAVFRPSTGEWFIDQMENPVKLGQAGDVPVPGNYFGDGKIHPAVYRNGKLLFADGKEIVLSVKGNANDLVNLPYAVRHVFFGK
jgi:hypothetical protein